MKYPRKAILLAAGYGTRMRPLTYDVPKPLIPVWGEPALGRMIDLMRSWGVDDILVNIHHKPGEMLQYLQKMAGKDVKISLSYEPVILGTGGALKKAEWFVAGDEAFWVVNTDIAADVTPEPFLRELACNNSLAVLWLNSFAGPRTVEMAGNRITNFKSKAPGSEGTFTFCGIQLVRGELLKYMPPENVFSIINIYTRAMAVGKRVSGLAVKNAFWAELGSPEEYLDAHRRILERYGKGGQGRIKWIGGNQLKTMSLLRKQGVLTKGFVSVGDGVMIDRSARISDSVIMDGAVIAGRSRISESVIARDTVVSGEGNGLIMSVDRVENDLCKKVINQLKWPSDKTLVQAMPGRGSLREFTRLRLTARGEQRSEKSVILVHYNPERKENLLYAGHARFLRRMGLRVPCILLDMPAECAVVAEDLGNITLEAAVKKMSFAEKQAVYKDVLDSLLILHKIPVRQVERNGVILEQSFSKKLYQWERDLFAKYYLEKQLKLTKKTVNKVMSDLEAVANHLGKASQVLIHRDMQSSNIMLYGKTGKPAFVDFQGMRWGPAVYDVASLLCDPYVMLSESLQNDLLEYYCHGSWRSDDVRQYFWYGAVERLAQALGAFGRLSENYATRRFAGYIGPAVVMMNRALGHIEGLKHLRKIMMTTDYAD